MRLCDAVLTGVGGLLIMACASRALAGEAAAPGTDAVGKDEGASREEIIKQADGLIAQLDDDDPGKREAATKALSQFCLTEQTDKAVGKRMK